jgi:hypothetical protein
MGSNDDSWSRCKFLKCKFCKFHHNALPACHVQLGFGFEGTRILRVSNPNESPWLWRWSVDSIPHTDNDVNVCAAIATIGNDLFIVGQNGRGNFIAKLALSALANRDYDQLQYFDASERWRAFDGAPMLTTRLLPATIPETTINYIASIDRYISFGIPFYVSFFSPREKNDMPNWWFVDI